MCIIYLSELFTRNLRWLTLEGLGTLFVTGLESFVVFFLAVDLKKFSLHVPTTAPPVPVEDA